MTWFEDEDIEYSMSMGLPQEETIDNELSDDGISLAEEAFISGYEEAARLDFYDEEHKLG